MTLPKARSLTSSFHHLHGSHHEVRSRIIKYPNWDTVLARLFADELVIWATSLEDLQHPLECPAIFRSEDLLSNAKYMQRLGLNNDGLETLYDRILYVNEAQLRKMQESNYLMGPVLEVWTSK